MAEDTEKKEETEETKASEPKKKGLPLGLIIGIVVTVLLLGGGGFYFYTTLNPANAEAEDEEVPEITETNIYFSGFQTNIVNLAESGESEYLYLKYGFDLEVLDNTVISELVEKLPRLTSLVAGLMSNREWPDIATAQGRDRLAREIVSGLNDAIATPVEEEGVESSQDKILGLYFTTYVAQ